MVEGPADAIDEVVARTQEAMAEASEIVLAGFRLRSDAKIVRWPDRYMDERGREFWGQVVSFTFNSSIYSITCSLLFQILLDFSKFHCNMVHFL